MVGAVTAAIPIPIQLGSGWLPFASVREASTAT
jgi:hypothetical protein